MAKLIRPTETKIFGSTALAAELTPFGSSTPSTDINLILNSVEAERGWGTIGVNGFPPMEWFNALGYGLSYYNAYLMQQGIPEWTALQNYYINSYTTGSDGLLYRSLSGVSGTPNVGNNPTTDAVNWINAMALYAKLASPAFTGIPTIGGVNVSGYSGLKNFIINGKFNIQQYSGVVSTGNGYKVDRWMCYLTNTSNATWVAPTGVNDGYLQLSALALGDQCVAEQRIENPAQFSGRLMMLSFELFGAYATANAIPYEVSLVHAGGRTSLFAGTAPAGTLKTTFSFAMPSLSGYTLKASSYLEIRPSNITSATATGTFGLRNVQLERGNIATNIENRPIGLELMMCQRYYEVMLSIGNQNYAAAGGLYSAAYISFLTTKRVTPTITLSGFVFNNANAVSQDSATINGFRLLANAVTTGSYAVYAGTATLSSEL